MTSDHQQVSRAADGYRWIVLTNTTVGILMVTINSSIVLISLPAIFRGIRLNPLEPANVSYLLWILQGFLVVTAATVIPFWPRRGAARARPLLHPRLSLLTPRPIGPALLFSPRPRPAPPIISTL